MKVKHNGQLVTLVALVVYIIALIAGVLNSKNNVLFLVLPFASFIWTILDTIYFAEKKPTFNKQVANDLGSVLVYQLPDLLAVLFLKFDQPISSTTKVFVGVLVIVNLIVVYFIDKKHYQNSVNN
ncbi:MAG: hypothetical protein LKH59_02715 [Lactobacillus crispatus]|jgi:uncharacterized membrane protein|uniref:hypothetical protein n=1 Tax=Lactobacillus crispatus TaxID=47770 RepID=UPI0018AB260C|nr:hypothetical protein [Lactobacillus crispatus]MCH4005241.1 hypothetical protein [Lactobacillus crispatus]MCI1335067.1 hypothetical protein [Lactobacillus crispatus]MCI1364459.1 hypothetical protein [Lactobacillus crispatus]MCI1492930.1 hypothetical protein [Lactobacillus crispatus]MCI1523553.1 hypothetical protein [Lactobacillus crispatus]